MTGGTNLRALLNAAQRVFPIDREDALRVVRRVTNREAVWSGATHSHGQIWTVGRIRQLRPLVDCAVDLLTDPAVLRANLRRWRLGEIKRAVYRSGQQTIAGDADRGRVHYAEILGELTLRTVEAPDPATTLVAGNSSRHLRLTVFR